MLIIAATNRDLKAGVDAGQFRSDLYFRLNVLPIGAPPLSQHREDVALLIHYFSEHFAAQEGCAQPLWPEAVIQRLEHYPWPGNVRELRNLVERMTILYPGQEILPQWLPDEYLGSPQNAAPGEDYSDAIEARERELIVEALRQSGGRKGQAAERLGISRHALKRRIQRLGIEGL